MLFVRPCRIIETAFCLLGHQCCPRPLCVAIRKPVISVVSVPVRGGSELEVTVEILTLVALVHRRLPGQREPAAERRAFLTQMHSARGEM
jgi:hypothetical protein